MARKTKAICESSIASVIKTGSQDLQAREPLGPIVLIVSALLAIVVAAVSSNHFSTSDGVKQVHAPGPDLDQASSAQAAATLVFATASNATKLITVANNIVAEASLT